MPKQRFVVLPGTNVFNMAQRTGAGGLMARATTLLRPMSAGAVALSDSPVRGGPKLDVKATIQGEHGVDAMLVELDEQQRLALRVAHPDLRIVPEATATMALARQRLQPIVMAGMAGAGLSPSTITIEVVDDHGKPVRSALVRLVTDPRTNPPTGAEATTNAKGEAKLILPKSIRQAAYLSVEPIHSLWPSLVMRPKLPANTRISVGCPTITQPYGDSLAVFAGPGKDTDGRGVVVAVIDGGAGAHASLRIAGGRNFAEGETAAATSDNGLGHGTHVAGIIASHHGKDGIQGVAPGVALNVYRVYPKDSMATGSFAVATAIKQAVDDGADLINLSLTFDHDAPDVLRQIERGRALGTLCIASAGNEAGPVMVPARYDAVLGVSALGCRGCWPKGSAQDLVIRAKPKGKNAKHFVATFSCTGAEVDLAGAGVGVVSLYPGDRLAVMNGTSMAAPAITGLVARRLAPQASLLGMPRDQSRSDAILALALKAATDLGFPPGFQGRGTLS